MHHFTGPIMLVFAMTWREKIASASWLELVLWIGLALLLMALLVLVGTRWGQVRPVSKCVVLSVFAHLLFLFYAYGTSFSFRSGGLTGDPFVQVKYLVSDDLGGAEDSAQDDSPAAAESAAEDRAPPESAQTAEPVPAAQPPVLAQAPEFAEVTSPMPATQTPPELLPSPVPPPPPTESANEAKEVATSESSETTPPAPSEAVAAQSADKPASEESVASTTPTEPVSATNQIPAAQNESPPPARDEATSRSEISTAVAAETPMPAVRPVDGQPVPDAYRMRVTPDRLHLAIPWGATEHSEAAVTSALQWLAAQQEPDGRWDASEFGAGRETRTLGQDRRGAGADADAGISGLALLAFLGSGHTHMQGQYRETVQHGLEFLMRCQQADGSLVGEAKDFEKMYCHGIALIAISEAYAMTGDSRLQATWRRGIQYTLTAQDAISGGWRYRPGERGDLSQCGWQVMALRSADVGGYTVPVDARLGVSKFLDSVTQGTHGGLASYRPRERVTRTMTAEAFVCRLLMDLPVTEAAINEANDYLLRELPGQDEPNLYYWYYATLYLFQLQGDAWTRWNDALQQHLIGRQARDGRLAGSWDTRDAWGGYGGRVYTTAMSALCLEVYYRFLPIYDPANSVRAADAIRDPNAVRR